GLQAKICCSCSWLHFLKGWSLLKTRCDSVRRDELLAQAVATHQGGVAARGKNQAVVRAQQKRHRYSPQRPEASDQSVFQSSTRRAGPTASRQMPAKQLTCVAVDHQR